METTIDLRQFCDNGESSRYDLADAIIQDGVAYYMDGKICVCVPTTAPNSTPKEGKRYPKDIVNVVGYPQFDDADGWEPIPSDAPVEIAADPLYCDCEGEPTECDECDGTGEAECYACGSTCECEECNGTGDGEPAPDKNCKRCNGTGKIPWRQRRVFGRLIDERYFDKIRTLPNVTAKQLQDCGILLFRFDGGRGVVCNIADKLGEDMYAKPAWKCKQ